METPMPGGGTLRSRTLEEIKKVKWDPAWGEERISNMIATRPDWCISRQRVWGVPIAVFLCEGCGKPLNDPAVNRKSGRNCSRASGADAWYTPEADTILPAGTKCPHCGGTKFREKRPTFSTCGSSPAPAIWRCSTTNPAIPGPPIFISKAATSTADGFTLPCSAPWARAAAPPYHGVVTPGWTLDEKGQAMSKSRGNDVDPVTSPAAWAERSCVSG